MKNQEQFPYVLGIDLGANSIGWAVMSCEEREGDKPEVIDVNLTGSRIFEAGTEGDVETGKDESRAKKRRSARLIRRQTNRRAMRTFDLYRRLQAKGLLPAISPQEETLSAQRAARDPALAELDRDILKRWTEKLKKQGVSDEEIRLLAKRMPYLLRARALDEKLPPLELGRAIYHLGQRRGFQSNRKGGSKDDEDKGEVKKEIKVLDETIAATGARTLGEFYSKINPESMEDKEAQDKTKGRIRTRWTSRDMYKHEFEEIWKAQQNFYPDILNDDFKKEIYDTIFDQRPLKSQSHLIGECEHEPGHKRAPIACLLFQRFRVLQNVNNLRITSEGITRNLSDEEREKVISALEGEGDLLDEKGVLTFAKIKKNLLGLKKGKINFEKGNQKGLIGDRTGLALQKIFKEKWDQLDYEHKEKLVDDIMSIEKDDALVRRAMNVWGLDEAAAKELAEIELEPDHCGLSRMALKKLITRMEQGEPYMTAVANTYDPPPPEPEEFLPPVREALKELKNPVVERSLTEMRKVVNAIIREHGKPAMIRIELARDIRNPRQKRKEISDRISKNEKERNNAAEELKKGIEEIKITVPNNREILKYRLWEECNKQCPYTGKMISAKDLFGKNSQLDIEHIIPFSRSLDNSFMNKTLCENNENKNVKGNKTPWEAYGGDEEKYSQIIGRVKQFTGDAKDAKLRRFQMKDEELKEMMADFSTRQLNDTRYASKLAVRYLSRLYGASGQFKTPEGKMMVVGVDEQGRRRVQVCAGMVTAHIRNELGLRTIWNSILEETYPKLEEEEESREPQSNEKERIDHRHHAIDAIAVGLASPGMVKKLADAAKKAPQYKRKLYAPMDQPWPGFLDDVREQINNITVSHRVSRKVNGPVHKETNYGKPRKDGKLEYVHLRKPIKEMTKKEIENIVDPVIKKKVTEKLKELGGDNKKFSDPENLPRLETKDKRTIPIKKARFRMNLKTEPVGEGPRKRNIVTGSNHHIEIYEYKDKKGNVKWDGEVVSTFEAMRRLRKKEPVVKRDHGEGKKFIYSLAINEGVLMKSKRGREELYRVQKIGQNKQIFFIKNTDARLVKDIPSEDRSRYPNRLRESEARKVLLDPLGNIRRAND